MSSAPPKTALWPWCRAGRSDGRCLLARGGGAAWEQNTGPNRRLRPASEGAPEPLRARPHWLGGSSGVWRAARKPVSPSEKAVVASCSPPKMAIFNSLVRLDVQQQVGALQQRALLALLLHAAVRVGDDRDEHLLGDRVRGRVRVRVRSEMIAMSPCGEPPAGSEQAQTVTEEVAEEGN